MGDLLGNGASLGETSPWGWVLRSDHPTPLSVPSLLPKGGHIETSRPRLPSVPFQPRQEVLLTLRVKISPFLPELLHVRYSVITRKTQSAKMQSRDHRTQVIFCDMCVLTLQVVWIKEVPPFHIRTHMWYAYVCTWVFICVGPLYACRCMYTCALIHVEAKGWGQVSS